MSVHRIRLIGPWEYRWTEPAEIAAAAGGIHPFEATGSVKMPCDWSLLFGSVAGQAIFSRRFHRPTNLESHEQVFIVLTGVGGHGTVSLDGNFLQEFSVQGGTVEVDVTNRLQAFNVLEIGVRFSPSTESPTRGGLYDAVVLEIRTSDANP